MCYCSCDSHKTNVTGVLSSKLDVQLLLLLLLLLSWRARQALPIWVDKDVPKRWGNPPDSKSGGICLSLVIVDSHFIDWGTTQGRLSLPTADVLSTIVKRSMLTDVDKLSSCSRFSDSVVGFTGQKTQPTASKYLLILTFWHHFHRFCLCICAGTFPLPRTLKEKLVREKSDRLAVKFFTTISTTGNWLNSSENLELSTMDVQ